MFYIKNFYIFAYMNKEINHGDVIVKYKTLDYLLKPYGMYVYAWGYINICKFAQEGDGGKQDVITNMKNINEVEKWVEGFLYAMELTKKETDERI